MYEYNRVNKLVPAYISTLVRFLHKIMLTGIYSSLISVTLPLAFSIHISLFSLEVGKMPLSYPTDVFFHIHHISFETYRIENPFLLTARNENIFIFNKLIITACY